MKRKTIRRNLTSCTVSVSLVRQLETYLTSQVPNLFRKSLASMRELYGSDGVDLQRLRLLLRVDGKEREYQSVDELGGRDLPRGLRFLRLSMELGRPELLTAELRFPLHGRPTLMVSSPREGAGKACQKVADGLESLLLPAGNRHRLLNNRPLRLGLALLLPAPVIAWGLLSGIDPVRLVALQGWLVLLAIGLSLLLQRVLPLVSFRTERRLDWRRLGFLSLLGLTLAATAGYVALEAGYLW